VSPIFVNVILPTVVALVVTAGVFAIWSAGRKRVAAQTIGQAEERVARILKDAERDAEALKKEAVLAAKEKAHDLLVEAERQSTQQRQQAAALEQTLARQTAALSDRQTTAERLERELAARDRAVSDREKATTAAASRYEQLVATQQRELERVAGLTAEEAKDLLIKQMEGEARHDAANLFKRLDAEARETAVDKAKQYITEAIQRCGAEHAIETTVSVVDLPSDDPKGRIIGREGRNIRRAPNCYRRRPHRRRHARRDHPVRVRSVSPRDCQEAIERLIADGRIHPARIEEVVQKVKDETDEEVRKEGAAVAFELGLHDLHPEILRLMGRLKFRTSYGQNVLSHSAEVARLAGIMAREVGLDAHVAVRAAFVHDIGKAIDREMEGTHLQIGIDFLRKHGESEPVVMAMAAHHMDIDWPSLEAMIVQAADAISAARPGARRDILESYVKRLEKLEGIADSFKGVSKSFALQAGREIRIMVESEKISDEEAVWLSKDIARRIENELEYPGQIKVTVIRETRAVDYAK
jgi:ribonuclease Y